MSVRSKVPKVQRCFRRAAGNALLGIVTLLLGVHVAAFSKPSINKIVTLLPDGSSNQVLCQLLANTKRNDTQLVSLDGFVSKRRAIGKSLVFLDIVPSDLPKLGKEISSQDFASMKPVQVLMRRDIWCTINEQCEVNVESKFDVYQKIIQPGVYCRIIGEAGPSRVPNEALLFCHSMTYILPNDNPQHLRNVVRLTRDGLLDIDEVREALPCLNADELMQMLNKSGETNYTNGECAVELLSRFPRNFLLNPSNLMGNSASAKVALLPPVPNEYVPPQDISSWTLDEFSTDISTVKQVFDSFQDRDFKRIQQFAFSGWVQNRRRFQDSTTVVEIVGTFSSSAEVAEKNSQIDMTNSQFYQVWSDRIHAVIHPDTIDGVETAEKYGNILAPGSKVLVQGFVTQTEQFGLTICWLSTCRLLCSSWKLGTIRHILQLLHENKIPTDEAAEALSLEGGYAQAEDIANGSTSNTERQWMAAEISQALQGEHSRYGKITPLMAQSLEQYSTLRDRYPIKTGVESIELHERLHSRSSASARTAPDASRWERAKKPQLAWMIEQISDVLKSHPEYGKRSLKIIDIGGGKGLLSNLLAETFKEKVQVHVVDISRSATNNGQMRARRRGIENVSYSAQDATTLNADGVDIVVALHACGALSDVALGHAVNEGAGFVICPCCFKSNPHLGVPTPIKEGSTRKLIRVEEWLQVQEFYEPLKQLAELQGDMKLATEAMHSICALRASAVERTWTNNKLSGTLISTTIQSFPIGISTRNLCLVGKFHPK